MKRKGALQVDQILIIILVLLAVAAVLFFVYKTDINTYVANLPGFYAPQEDVVIEDDSLAGSVLCPIIIGVIDGTKTGSFNSAPIYLVKDGVIDRTYNKILFDDGQVTINRNWRTDPVIGSYKEEILPFGEGDAKKNFIVKRISMDSGVLGGSGDIFSKVKFDIPSRKSLYDLDGAYIYDMKICRDKESIGFEIRGEYSSFDFSQLKYFDSLKSITRGEVIIAKIKNEQCLNPNTNPIQIAFKYWDNLFVDFYWNAKTQSALAKGVGKDFSFDYMSVSSWTLTDCEKNLGSGCDDKTLAEIKKIASFSSYDEFVKNIVNVVQNNGDNYVVEGTNHLHSGVNEEYIEYKILRNRNGYKDGWIKDVRSPNSCFQTKLVYDCSFEGKSGECTKDGTILCMRDNSNVCFSSNDFRNNDRFIFQIGNQDWSFLLGKFGYFKRCLSDYCKENLKKEYEGWYVELV